MNLTPLYSAEAIEARVKDIAAAINRDFKGADLVHVVITLNGAFIFAADLVRKLEMPQVIHFAGATSYYGVSQGELRINADALPRSFGNKPVILIEDIMDSGKTIGMLRQIIADRFSGPLKVAALLKRQGGDGNCDYTGFTVPRGLFVVGYGMDMDSRYRELKEIKAFAEATMMCESEGGVC